MSLALGAEELSEVLRTSVCRTEGQLLTVVRLLGRTSRHRGASLERKRFCSCGKARIKLISISLLVHSRMRMFPTIRGPAHKRSDNFLSGGTFRRPHGLSRPSGLTTSHPGNSSYSNLTTFERSGIWAIRKKDKLGAGSACGVREAAGVCVGLGSNKLALSRHSVARIPVRLLDKPYSLTT
jgi:hypothetical protein